MTLLGVCITGSSDQCLHKVAQPTHFAERSIMIKLCINSLVTCLILLVNHVFILVRTGRITLWMIILVRRRHAIRQQKKLVHAFATDLKATGPADQHKINCCGPNWPDDLKNACGQRAHSQCRALYGQSPPLTHVTNIITLSTSTFKNSNQLPPPACFPISFFNFQVLSNIIDSSYGRHLHFF